MQKECHRTVKAADNRHTGGSADPPRFWVRATFPRRTDSRVSCPTEMGLSLKWC
ncbi:predicted protein [Botrytis cinerea T4]|uniref:Uncharacterized protein n=1 Tax=Botryotinia fuckeliana (strain T4) TaxID=999810 RepID=G2YN06_BOTF4|nr:predicted protein [Botrytis cinerea T4]